jgi:hypothetical protein
MDAPRAFLEFTPLKLELRIVELFDPWRFICGQGEVEFEMKILFI